MCSLFSSLLHVLSPTQIIDKQLSENNSTPNKENKMKIICAGFPKTGTKSMANALTQLGYQVHDFEEHLEYNLDNYVRFFDGDIGEEVFAE